MSSEMTLQERKVLEMEEMYNKDAAPVIAPTPDGRWDARRTRDGRSRSIAWVFYAILSAAGFMFLCTDPGHVSHWVGEALLIMYARYLYRGGRFVLWVF